MSLLTRTFRSLTCSSLRYMSTAASSSSPAAAAAAAPAAPSSPAASSDLLRDPTAPLGLTGGAPIEFVRRHCRIYKPSRSATQQGPEYRWKIEFDSPNKWVNPLMGWTSTRDTAGQLREVLYFDTEDLAKRFADREGFTYTIMPYHAKKIKAKAFADNFKWRGPPKA